MPHLSNARRTELAKLLEDNPDLKQLMQELFDGYDGLCCEYDGDGGYRVDMPLKLTNAVDDLGDILT